MWMEHTHQDADAAPRDGTCEGPPVVHKTLAAVLRPRLVLHRAHFEEEPQQEEDEDAERDELDDDTGFQQL